MMRTTAQACRARRLAVEYKYISADDHLDTRWLPRNIWQDRLPERLKSVGPKVIDTPDGTFWEWEGKRRVASNDGADNAKSLKFFHERNLPAPAGSLPPTDAKLRLQHMDAAGIYSSLMYGDTRKWAIEDTELRLEAYRAYNDFVLELNSEAPDRLLGMPCMPTMNPEACVDELQRVVKKGARAVEFGVFDVGKPLYDEVWLPFWAALEESGVPMGCHIGDKSGAPYPPNVRGSLLAHFSVVPFVAAPPIAQMVFSGALERHPNLRVCFAECRVGWIPFLISWMDRQIHEREPDPTAKLSMLPSEYIKRQVRFTFEDDIVGAKLINEDWSYIKDSAMWGADYPHGQGVWGHNIDEKLAIVFEGWDPAMIREVTHDRAARFYNLKAPVTA
jgi:uncharacterized protein